MASSPNINARKKRINKSDLIFIIAMLLVPTVQFAIFYIGTNLNSFALSFKTYDKLGGGFVPNGWNNFERVIQDFKNNEEVMSAFGNSFKVYGVGLITSVPVAILFAFYVYKKFFGFRTFKVLLFLPSMLSILTLCILYRIFADNAVPSVVNKVFNANMQGFFADLKTEYAALMFAFVFFSFGTTLLLYLGAISDVPEAVMEAAEIDGASNFVQLTRIVLPSIFPTIKTFFVCGLAGLFSNQFNLFNFYGTGAEAKYETIGYYFYKLTINGQENYSYVAAFGLMLSLVLVPVTLVINKLLERLQDKIA